MDTTNTTKQAGTAASVPSETEVAERVEALLGRMSLEEKVGQLTQIGGAAFIPGPKPEDDHPQGRGRLGAVAQRHEAVQRSCRRSPSKRARRRSRCSSPST